eukprot:256844-Pelagomonas_calceolata.AAC.3
MAAIAVAKPEKDHEAASTGMAAVHSRQGSSIAERWHAQYRHTQPERAAAPTGMDEVHSRRGSRVECPTDMRDEMTICTTCALVALGGVAHEYDVGYGHSQPAAAAVLCSVVVMMCHAWQRHLQLPTLVTAC